MPFGDDDGHYHYKHLNIFLYEYIIFHGLNYNYGVLYEHIHLQHLIVVHEYFNYDYVVFYEHLLIHVLDDLLNYKVSK